MAMEILLYTMWGAAGRLFFNGCGAQEMNFWGKAGNIQGSLQGDTSTQVLGLLPVWVLLPSEHRETGTHAHTGRRYSILFLPTTSSHGKTII